MDREPFFGVALLCLFISVILPNIPVEAEFRAETGPLLEQHEGDLVINGSRALLMEDASFAQKGDIYVTDNATLMLVNVTLRMGRVLERLLQIHINGSGRIECINSKLDPESWVMVRLYGNASALVEDTEFFSDFGVYYVPFLYKNRTLPFSGFDLGGRSRLEAQGSEVGLIILGENASCRVGGSTISSFGACSSQPAIVHNSTIDTLRLSFGHTTVNISGEFHGFHRYMDAEGVEAEGVRPSFRLHNTTILNSELVVSNCVLNLQNTNITTVLGDSLSEVNVRSSEVGTIVFGERGGLRADIHGSKIGWLHCWMDRVEVNLTYSHINNLSLNSHGPLSLNIQNCSVITLRGIGSIDEKRVNIRDSIIRFIEIKPNEFIQYNFDDTIIEGRIFLPISVVKLAGRIVILGGLRFGENASLARERNGGHLLLTRYYDVKEKTMQRRSPKMVLELRRGGEKVWTGETDEWGEATFPITFADINWPPTPRVYNMTDKLTLVASDGRNIVEVEVGLLTDTPILIEIPQPGAQTNIMTAAAFIIVVALIGFIIYLLRKARWL